jgi:hypothetical protein
MTAGDDLLGIPALDGRPAHHQAERRTQVLSTLADILIAAGTHGRRFTVVDAGADGAAGFADDLAAVVRDADGCGWSLVRYDDPPHRFYALAERSGPATQAPLVERSVPAG